MQTALSIFQTPLKKQTSLLGEPPKEIRLSTNPYLNLASVLPGICLPAAIASKASSPPQQTSLPNNVMDAAVSQGTASQHAMENYFSYSQQPGEYPQVCQSEAAELKLPLEIHCCSIHPSLPWKGRAGILHRPLWHGWKNHLPPLEKKSSSTPGKVIFHSWLGVGSGPGLKPLQLSRGMKGASSGPRPSPLWILSRCCG
uniref:Uncharacterized protein n=1 Tax=Ficedula albicollis TaxID=59894 RepID=A0A803VWH8_FICAL